MLIPATATARRSKAVTDVMKSLEEQLVEQRAELRDAIKRVYQNLYTLLLSCIDQDMSTRRDNWIRSRKSKEN